MMDHFYRRRAEIYYADGSQPPVHVSGHASEEELKLVVTLAKPKYFIPIHGTYRQLHRHAKLVEKTCVVSEKVIVAETGNILRFGPAGAEIVGKAPVGRVLIDEGSLEEVEEVVIRDRRHISEDGIILSIIAINKQTGMVDHFRLALATEKALNVFLTVNLTLLHVPKLGHDIVRVERMELSGGDGASVEKIQWDNALTSAEAKNRLAKVFYKAHEIDWLPYDQALAQARSRNRPIFAIVSWGSPDDQSC